MQQIFFIFLFIFSSVSIFSCETYNQCLQRYQVARQLSSDSQKNLRQHAASEIEKVFTHGFSKAEVNSADDKKIKNVSSQACSKAKVVSDNKKIDNKKIENSLEQVGLFFAIGKSFGYSFEEVYSEFEKSDAYKNLIAAFPAAKKPAEKKKLHDTIENLWEKMKK